MATLETISIDIKANAQGAGKEIANLVHNIRSLAKAAGTAVAALNSLNTVLNQLKGNSNINFPFLNGGNRTGATTASPNSAFMERFNRSLLQIAGTSNEASNGVSRFGEDVRQAGHECEQSGRRASRYGGILGQIGRIAKMMVIRTAVRALIKGFQQSWQAAYQFSKQINGTFAKAVDATKTMIADTTTSLVQTFAPVLEALVPILYTITQAIQWLCQQLQYLMSLLGMTSELFGASTQQINKYYGSTNKASKSQKNLLASWDELNVIQSKNNGSTGGGYNPGALKSLVGTEIDGIMQLLVGEGMLAIGAILACTGHFGLGIGCMIIGASAIAKTVSTDWNKLPDNVQRTILNITGILSVAAPALGIIMLCAGHIGLGLGLLAIGAVNLFANAYASESMNGDEVTNKVASTLVRVAGIVALTGVGMTALGVILCCFGAAAAGIPLILAGIASFGGAVAANWDGDLVSTVRTVWGQVEEEFGRVWAVITNYANQAWDAIAKWWNENIWRPIATAWDGVVSFFTGIWDDITSAANSAFDSVAAWWEDTGIGQVVRGAWSDVVGFFSMLFGDADTDGSIAQYATNAWNTITRCWENTGMGERVRTAWANASKFFQGVFDEISKAATDLWNGIPNFAEDFWHGVQYFGEDAWATIQSVFNDIYTGAIEPICNTIVDGVRNAFTNIWTFVTGWFASDDLWNTIFGVIRDAWDATIAFFDLIFGGPDTQGSIAYNACKAVKDIQNGFIALGDFMYDNVAVPVGNAFADIINGIIDGINFVITKINEIAGTKIGTLGKLEKAMTKAQIKNLNSSVGYFNTSDVNASRYAEEMEKRYKKKGIGSNAEGGYGIPSGDLFIANEHGAELVGQIGGKTSVANQQQIIEGISSGVRDANAEQNRLLMQQNELLRSLLDKEWNVEPSAAWGKHNQRSAEMWAMVTGR